MRKISPVVYFSFFNDLVKDRSTQDFDRPTGDPEFMLRLYLLSTSTETRTVRPSRMPALTLSYKYFMGLVVDEDVPDDTTISYFGAQRLGEEKFMQVFEQIVR